MHLHDELPPTGSEAPDTALPSAPTPGAETPHSPPLLPPSSSAPHPPDTPDTPDTLHPPHPPIPALRQNIKNAFRLTFLVRVAEQTMPVSWWQAVCFAILSMAVPVIWAMVTVGGSGQWSGNSLPGAVFHIPMLLLAAILIAYAMDSLDKTLTLFQAFLMIAFAVDIIYYAAFFAYYRLAANGGSSIFVTTIFFAATAWTAIACAIAAMRVTGALEHARMAPVLIGALLIALPLSSVNRDRSLWEQDSDGPEQAAQPMARNDVTAEDNFYRQPQLLERELAAVRPQRPGVTEVFFIGVAGYGGQDVFQREVDSVAKLFRERFDADGHTIRLINNPKVAASVPIASVTSLTASLKRVADVMDKDEDVLVLFLTSHGSEAHRFSLELWPLHFKELDPAKLRALLDESGIKHRVVVISACYSGGFINDLKDDDTLVITSSAPDRNSFGCSNENDWTYFGKAYFDEALRKTYSITEAFDIALPVIAAREQKDEYKPSNPQISVGRNIAATLDRLQAQLADTALKNTVREHAGAEQKGGAVLSR